MLSKSLVAALCLFLSLPTLATAAEHYVIITGYGFFPEVSYVQPGDTVHFHNSAGLTHLLSGGHTPGDQWTVTVGAYGAASIQVTGQSTTVYNSVNAPLEPAQLSFDAPPEEAQVN